MLKLGISADEFGGVHLATGIRVSKSTLMGVSTQSDMNNGLGKTHLQLLCHKLEVASFKIKFARNGMVIYKRGMSSSAYKM